MAKKRKASRQAEAPSGPREYDAKDARLNAINTFEDVADEQEEYFLDKDKIAFESERGTKRQRQQQEEEEFVDLSDDEVFRRDSDDSANESGEDDGARRKQKKKEKKAKAKKVKAERVAKMADDDDNDDDETETKAAGGEDDSGWWGSSKEHYYDGDAIETEDGAMEEEAEARRLQKKQLSRMKASDFFDADDWTTDANAAAPTAEQDAGAGGATKSAAASGPAGAVTMTIMAKSDLDAMTADEKYKLLQDQYPELDHLCDEFSELEPLMSKYKESAAGKAPETLEVVQFRALSCYVATIALYFSILMSPSRDDPSGTRYVMDADELHNHEVMEYLVVARNNWEWVKRVQARRAAKAAKASKAAKLEAAAAAAAKKSSAPSSAKERLQLLDTIPETMVDSSSSKAAKMAKKEKKAKSKKAAAASKAIEDSLADLLPKKAKTKTTKSKAAKKSADSDDEGHSDLGEEEAIDARTADEKAKRKKSLGFYTSQIMQKSSMRSGATGQAGGDVDIPYRERLRDRQERLHTAAVRRGMNEAPNELGGSDDDDVGEDNGEEHAAERDANLSYYDSIVNAHKEKMAAKEARKAEAEAMKLQRVTPGEWADKDGRRQLTWEIEKNKGLSHKTLKEKKNNPRVKKRIKFEKKKKQLASMRATYKPMNPSDYQGERTGIKTGLIRSIKLE